MRQRKMTLYLEEQQFESSDFPLVNMKSRKQVGVIFYTGRVE
jgi:hypothetical protein